MYLGDAEGEAAERVNRLQRLLAGLADTAQLRPEVEAALADVAMTGRTRDLDLLVAAQGRLEDLLEMTREAEADLAVLIEALALDH